MYNLSYPIPRRRPWVSSIVHHQHSPSWGIFRDLFIIVTTDYQTQTTSSIGLNLRAICIDYWTLQQILSMTNWRMSKYRGSWIFFPLARIASIASEIVSNGGNPTQFHGFYMQRLIISKGGSPTTQIVIHLWISRWENAFPMDLQPVWLGGGGGILQHRPLPPVPCSTGCLPPKMKFPVPICSLGCSSSS